MIEYPGLKFQISDDSGDTYYYNNIRIIFCKSNKCTLSPLDEAHFGASKETFLSLPKDLQMLILLFNNKHLTL